MNHTDKLGIQGENIAANHLINSGYKILFRRYTLPRWGELDIIAVKNRTIYFVEVKTSKSLLDPLEAINYHKLKYLERSIEYFFTKEGQPHINMHRIIKVIGIKLGEKSKFISLDDIDLF